MYIWPACAINFVCTANTIAVSGIGYNDTVCPYLLVCSAVAVHFVQVVLYENMSEVDMQ